MRNLILIQEQNQFILQLIFDFYTSKTYKYNQPDCPDDVRSVYHAYRYYKYLMELVFENVYQIKKLRVFFNKHRDFQLEEYSIN